MAEYIDKEAIRNELYWEDALTMRGVKLINQFPAADVVEVVRCKDCKCCMEFRPKFKKSGYYGTCRRLLIPMLEPDEANVKEDDYCSYGVRKEG